MARTTSEQESLRESAQQKIANKGFELDDKETTGDGTCLIQVGPVVSGVVIDRLSMDGRVVVSGQHVEVQMVKTGPGEPGERYPEIPIQPGQTCVIYGHSTVIYYKLRP